MTLPPNLRRLLEAADNVDKRFQHQDQPDPYADFSETVGKLTQQVADNNNRKRFIDALTAKAEESPSERQQKLVDDFARTLGVK